MRRWNRLRGRARHPAPQEWGRVRLRVLILLATIMSVATMTALVVKRTGMQVGATVVDHCAVGTNPAGLVTARECAARPAITHTPGTRAGSTSRSPAAGRPEPLKDQSDDGITTFVF